MQSELALPHGRSAATTGIVDTYLFGTPIATPAGLLFLSRRDKTTVAQQFIAGIARIGHASPGGTAEGSWPMKQRGIFSRAYGTYWQELPFQQ